MKVKCEQCSVSVINGIPCHEQGCSHYFIFTKRGREYLKCCVWALDVWGNEHDGFEVNDRSVLVESLFIPRFGTVKQIIKALKKCDALYKRAHFKSYFVEDNDLTIYINWNKNLRPILELEIQ